MLRIKNFVEGCITMEQIVTYLLMVQKFTNARQKTLKFLWVQYVLYDFSIDYDATDVDDIKDIQKYLMKKNNIV